ncbi:MAG: hypothetical protein Q9196_005597 [Gyalolechia fulgens]
MDDNSLRQAKALAIDLKNVVDNNSKTELLLANQININRGSGLGYIDRNRPIHSPKIDRITAGLAQPNRKSKKNVRQAPDAPNDTETVAKPRPTKNAQAYSGYERVPTPSAKDTAKPGSPTSTLASSTDYNNKRKRTLSYSESLRDDNVGAKPSLVLLESPTPPPTETVNGLLDEALLVIENTYKALKGAGVTDLRKKLAEQFNDLQRRANAR